MQYRVTVRYGGESQRYHIFTVSADRLVGALQDAARELPDDVAESGDLVEIRPAVDPDARRYLDEADASAEPRDPGG